MKASVAMMICAVLRARAEGFVPAGDVLLAVVSDEEQGGDYGAKWMAQIYPELLSAAILVRRGRRRNRPISRASEFLPDPGGRKGNRQLQATLRGPGGHGSIPMHGGAMAKLGKLLTTLDTHRLPVHITPAVEAMIRAVAAALPAPQNSAMLDLLDPTKTDVLSIAWAYLQGILDRCCTTP